MIGNQVQQSLPTTELIIPDKHWQLPPPRTLLGPPTRQLMIRNSPSGFHWRISLDRSAGGHGRIDWIKLTVSYSRRASAPILWFLERLSVRRESVNHDPY